MQLGCTALVRCEELVIRRRVKPKYMALVIQRTMQLDYMGPVQGKELVMRKALARQRTGLAKRRGLVNRNALVQSRGWVKRRENRQMVQDDIADYPERDWT